jgi:hypothetical protein
MKLKSSLPRLILILASVSALIPSAVLCFSTMVQGGSASATEVFGVNARSMMETTALITCLGSLAYIGRVRLQRAHMMWLLSYTIILVSSTWSISQLLDHSVPNELGVLLMDVAASFLIFASIV